MISHFGTGGRGAGGGEDVSRFAMLAEVRAYWEGLRVAGDLPRRDQIDPRGIAGALENTFLLERVAPGIARFRLAGMQLHDLMGMDVRGMPLSAADRAAGAHPAGRGAGGRLCRPRRRWRSGWRRNAAWAARRWRGGC